MKKEDSNASHLGVGIRKLTNAKIFLLVTIVLNWHQVICQKPCKWKNLWICNMRQSCYALNIVVIVVIIVIITTAISCFTALKPIQNGPFMLTSSSAHLHSSHLDITSSHRRGQVTMTAASLSVEQLCGTACHMICGQQTSCGTRS